MVENFECHVGQIFKQFYKDILAVAVAKLKMNQILTMNMRHKISSLLPNCFHMCNSNWDLTFSI